MCGIAGFCSKKNDNVSVIRAMTDAINHRGPDRGNFYIDENTGVTLGHRRLSIVDLSEAGTQPMVSADGRYVLIYNGEIYNASEIKEELKASGRVPDFRGSSDTEVLLTAIQEYGAEAACTKTIGMFAFAVYDREDASITLGRDRAGEKPLYYGHINGDFVFASDMGALMKYPDMDNGIDKTAVSRFLRYSYIPGDMTIYEGVFKLKPGTIRRFEYPYNESNEIVYYDLRKEYIRGLEKPFAGTFQEAVDELEKRLKAAVRRQLISDVPLGAFLSGGIDSATIVALMQSINTNPVKTFTIGFEEEKYDESVFSAEIARHLGTAHTAITVSEQNLIDVVPRLCDIFTEPFADSSQIPTYLVSKLAKSQVTVSLSGDAGDELFGGYNTYWKISELYNRTKHIPALLRHGVGRAIRSCNNNTLFRLGNCLMADDIGNLHEAVSYDDNRLRPGHVPQELLLPPGTGSMEDEMMLRDLLRYHPDDILVKVDRAGMAVSLENRVPMLDREVLALTFSMPVDYKLSYIDGTWVTKRVLKEVLYRYVPKEMMERPKKGFSVPLERWLTDGPVHEAAWDILTDSHIARDCIWSQEAISRIMHQFEDKNLGKDLLWNIFILEQWYRRYHG